MKRLFLIPAIFTTMSCFAQTTGNMNDPLFNFDNAGSPKEITKLGTSPEFPFLRNMSTPGEVASAIRRNYRERTHGTGTLNNMLVSLGFTNGANDVDASNITMYYIPYGTVGNMGSGNYTVEYCKLDAGSGGNKAYKISSGTGAYMYILAKCGNAFFPKNTNATACINVPVNLTGERDVTLNSSGQTTTTTNNTYVYYEKKMRSRHATEYATSGIPDRYPSAPLLLRTTSDVQSVPEAYRVSLNSGENTVNVCKGTPLNLTANINVEKTSEYSGYYPAKDKKVYKKVSKRVYKMAARKMRKAKRKENRVARRTGVKVSNSALASK